MTAVEHREDLQCCPECGAKQMHESFKGVEVIEIRIRNGLYRVHCTRCGADGPETLRLPDSAKKWNASGTRMSDTPLTDERTLYTSELSAVPPRQSERNWKFAVVYAEFARGLELENARLRSELEAKMEDGYSPRLPNPHDD